MDVWMRSEIIGYIRHAMWSLSYRSNLRGGPQEAFLKPALRLAYSYIIMEYSSLKRGATSRSGGTKYYLVEK
jgi:hypothetical protein